ncbi:MAG: hypothetical protein K2X03_08320 [Bryobacteraceae bacterium]|nr:hypothetical protein [Bryobacteraceae bacterium]
MRPDFSGTFTLNRGLSEFAFLKPPRMRVDSIVHAEPSLTVTTLQIDTNGANTTVRKFTTDETPVTIEVLGKARQLKARWEASELVVETSWEHSGHPRILTDRWRLSPNGKQLVVTRHQEMNGGPVRQKFVLERENSGE